MSTLSYDATAHPLLDPAVLALSGVARQELNAVAEDMLGLNGSTVAQFQGDDVYLALRAVAYQMNYLVGMGTEGQIAAMSRRGARAITYRGNARGSAVRPVSPVAKQIINKLIGWATGVRSARSSW